MENVRYQLMKDRSLFKFLELEINFFNMVLFLSLSNDLFEKIYIHMTLQTTVVVFFVGPQIYLIFRNIVKIMFEAKLYLYKQ